MLEHMRKSRQTGEHVPMGVTTLVDHRLGRVGSEGMQDAPGLLWGLYIWARHPYTAV